MDDADPIGRPLLPVQVADQHQAGGEHRQQQKQTAGQKDLNGHCGRLRRISVRIVRSPQVSDTQAAPSIDCPAGTMKSCMM